ncbi:MAG: endonuclease III [Actinomycetota bacterium]|nr:endonuclease III [Actinomycetota bacterium]
MERNYPVRVWAENLTPFEVLVSTILSQATERRGNVRAFENLLQRFDMTPVSLARADIRELAECIKPAGLHNAKAAKIKAVSQVLLEEYGGDLMKILGLPRDEAREGLMELPGVGQKTADVLLNLVAGHPTFPVDTHIIRIARRLPLVKAKAGYEEIKAAFEKWTPPEKRRVLHLALIEHGREVCKAKPKCELCPIFIFCEKRGL